MNDEGAEDRDYWNSRYDCGCATCLGAIACDYCGGELDDFGDCRSDECEEDNED